jgi:hypothetical protein
VNNKKPWSADQMRQGLLLFHLATLSPCHLVTFQARRFDIGRKRSILAVTREVPGRSPDSVSR